MPVGKPGRTNYMSESEESEYHIDRSWSWSISSGVRQGCVAAPDLFNCIIDYLMENVSATVPGIQLGPYHLTDLEYADDAAMFATNQNDISSALAIFDAEACKLGLRTSWAKTKIMKLAMLHLHHHYISATMMSNLLTNSPTWVPSSPTRVTFNLI